jgi:arsenical resistance operon trans-acting repressor ArsD
MTFVTVFRHVPKPITGMIGTVYDPEFERFEANLDWLETTGVPVEQFDPSNAHQEVAKRPAVQQIVSAEGHRRLPLILMSDSIVSRGTYLSRAKLARAVGQRQGWKRSAA